MIQESSNIMLCGMCEIQSGWFWTQMAGVSVCSTVSQQIVAKVASAFGFRGNSWVSRVRNHITVHIWWLWCLCISATSKENQRSNSSSNDFSSIDKNRQWTFKLAVHCLLQIWISVWVVLYCMWRTRLRYRPECFVRICFVVLAFFQIAFGPLAPSQWGSL